MAWNGWSTMSQALEQVSKLKEDVEKKFDQAVANTQTLQLSNFTLSNTNIDTKRSINDEKNGKEEKRDELKDKDVIKSGDPMNQEKQQPTESKENKDIASNDVLNTVNEDKETMEKQDKEKDMKEVINIEEEKSDWSETEENYELDTMLQTDWEDTIEDSRQDPPNSAEVTEDSVQELPNTTATVQEAVINEQASVVEEKVIENEIEQESPEALNGKDQLDTHDLQKIKQLEEALQQRETQLLTMAQNVQSLHGELDKTCQREVEAVEKARQYKQLLESTQKELQRASNNRHVDTENQQLRIALQEKEETLQELLNEGKTLSIKIAQYEHRVRTLRKEKDDEAVNSQQIQAQVNSLQDQVVNLTDTLKNTQEQLKVSNLELETMKKVYTEQKKELESTHDTMKQLSNDQNTLETYKEERTSLKSKLESLASAAMENEKLLEEKKVLESTIQHLQRTLTDLEKESHTREEILREESRTLKKQWQQALMRVDELGESISEATRPLLREIQELQQSNRRYTLQYQEKEQEIKKQMELNETTAKKYKTELENKDRCINDLEMLKTNMQSTIETLKEKILEQQKNISQLQQSEREIQHQLATLQMEHQECHVKLQENMNSILKPSDDNNAQKYKDMKAYADQVAKELALYKEELDQLKADYQEKSTVSNSGSIMNGPKLTDENLHLELNLPETDMDVTVLGLSQLQQQLRIVYGTNRLLRQQLISYETKEKQASDELVRLQSRNLILEKKEMEFHQLKEEFQQLNQHQMVLLELFGEKEEQVEELQSEVQELKAIYKAQLDTLTK